MPTNSESTLRLYLATLPGDMAGERAILAEKVFPELRRQAARLGLDIVILDPAEDLEAWDLERRLDAISSCQIFVAFLGERYGDLPPATPEALLARYPFLAENPARSQLDLEIRCALAAPSVRSLCYLRDPDFLSAVPEERRAEYAPESPAAAKLLAELKAEIRASGRAVVDSYLCAWSKGHERLALSGFLAQQVLSQLSQALAEVRKELTGATTPAALPPEKPPVLHENVQFTVYRPRVVPPLDWVSLLAFAHLEELPADAGEKERDPIAEVQEQARRILGDLTPYSDLTEDSRHAVPHASEITFLPEVDGFEFNPPRRTFLWEEAVHREEFRMRAAASLDGQTARGRLSVFLGSLLLAEVTLRIKVDRQAAALRTEPPAERDSIRPFRNIFASYSHLDATVVEEFERYARAMGDRYLRDVHDLRAGEVWDDKLMHLIHEADVFQLFWSNHAMRSRFVEQEWRYALSLQRPSFIRPTYWEVPLPADPTLGLPPQELERLHFQLLSVGVGAHTPRGDLQEISLGVGPIAATPPPRDLAETAPMASAAPPPAARSSRGSRLRLLAAALVGFAALGLGTLTFFPRNVAKPTMAPEVPLAVNSSRPPEPESGQSISQSGRQTTSPSASSLTRLSAQVLSIARRDDGGLRVTVSFENAGDQPLAVDLDKNRSLLAGDHGVYRILDSDVPKLHLTLASHKSAIHTFDFQAPTLGRTWFYLTLATQGGRWIHVSGDHYLRDSEEVAPAK